MREVYCVKPLPARPRGARVSAEQLRGGRHGGGGERACVFATTKLWPYSPLNGSSARGHEPSQLRLGSLPRPLRSWVSSNRGRPRVARQVRRGNSYGSARSELAPRCVTQPLASALSEPRRRGHRCVPAQRRRRRHASWEWMRIGRLLARSAAIHLNAARLRVTRRRASALRARALRVTGRLRLMGRRGVRIASQRRWKAATERAWSAPLLHGGHGMSFSRPPASCGLYGGRVGAAQRSSVGIG
eukprot:scaffold582_cov385-Prasinococcus_capsulatus_cf.AAC.51